MKKIISLMLGLMFVAAMSYAAVGEVFSVGTNSAGDNAVTVDKNGILNAKLGMTNTYPYCNPPYFVSAPAAASNISFKNTAISTATLIAMATTFTTGVDLTDIIVPRNVVIFSSCTGVGSYTGTAVVTGVTALGVAATETIIVSSYTAVGRCIGNIAWSTITSVSLTSTAIDAAAVSIQIGGGTKIGLPFNITSASEILKVIENAAVSTTYTLSTTYDTIVFAAAPNGTLNYSIFAKPTVR